jgi:hypothetical protein
VLVARDQNASRWRLPTGWLMAAASPGRLPSWGLPVQQEALLGPTDQAGANRQVVGKVNLTGKVPYNMLAGLTCTSEGMRLLRERRLALSAVAGRHSGSKWQFTGPQREMLLFWGDPLASIIRSAAIPFCPPKAERPGTH